MGLPDNIDDVIDSPKYEYMDITPGELELLLWYREHGDLEGFRGMTVKKAYHPRPSIWSWISRAFTMMFVLAGGVLVMTVTMSLSLLKGITGTK